MAILYLLYRFVNITFITLLVLILCFRYRVVSLWKIIRIKLCTSNLFQENILKNSHRMRKIHNENLVMCFNNSSSFLWNNQTELKKTKP